MVSITMRAWGWLAPLLCLLLWPAIAAADDDADRAKLLFREGRDASARGDHATACTKYGESLVLFRRASTLLNLGACHDQLGRTATALAYWEQGAALLEPADPRMEVATQSVAELRLRAPRLTVSLPATLPAGAVITLDGSAVGRSLLDRELRLDPGPHELRLTAPGHHPSQVPIELSERAAEQVVLSLGPPLPPAPVVPPLLRPSHPLPPPPPVRTTPTWVWPVGGVGLAVAAVSIPFAVDYANTLSEQEDLCGGDLEQCQPDPPGSYDPAEDNGRKLRDAVLTTTFAAAGGLTLAAAAIGAIIGSEAPATEVALNVGSDGGYARLLVRF
ncbi:MAG: PEGA domain-containing protein [Deltaproteobacteria bacterium]|nr:PEGA domain-containing protein [Deltaproteobacteria bacterium]